LVQRALSALRVFRSTSTARQRSIPTAGVLSHREDIGLLDEELGLLDEEVGPLDEEIGPLDEEIGPLDEEVGLLDEEVGLLDEEVGLLDEEVGLLDEEVVLLDEEIVLLDEEVVLLDEKIDLPQARPQREQHNQPTTRTRNYCSFICSTRTLLGSWSVKRLCSTGAFTFTLVNS